MRALSNMGLLSRFVGMITDSRSFLSYSRHEYFRRLLCNMLGEDVRRGLLPDDRKALANLVAQRLLLQRARLLRLPARRRSRRARQGAQADLKPRLRRTSSAPLERNLRRDQEGLDVALEEDRSGGGRAAAARGRGRDPGRGRLARAASSDRKRGRSRTGRSRRHPSGSSAGATWSRRGTAASSATASATGRRPARRRATDRLGAGVVWSVEGMPWLTAPNITPDPETGIGKWSDDAVARAIREGIGLDGRALFSLMPYEEYRRIPDEDLAAIVVYIRSLHAGCEPAAAESAALPARLRHARRAAAARGPGATARPLDPREARRVRAAHGRLPPLPHADGRPRASSRWRWTWPAATRSPRPRGRSRRPTSPSTRRGSATTTRRPS